MTEHPLSVGDTRSPGACRPRSVGRRLVRTLVLLALAAIGPLLAPTPAFAWFGWLDRLSGPGPFSGPQFDARLVCFGPRVPWPETLLLMRAAQEMQAAAVAMQAIDDTVRIDKTTGPYRLKWEAVADAWLRAASALESLAKGVLTPGAASHYLGNIEAVREAIVRNKATVADSTGDVLADRASARKRDEAFREPVEKIAVLFEASAGEVDRTLNTTRGVGVLFSACSQDRERRASIDLSAAFWKADSTEQYANNQDMKLNMLIPSVTWNLIRDARFDMFDVGIGAGVYWFSSPGMPMVRGVVIEPFRLDFHAPSSWGRAGLTDRDRTRFLRSLAALFSGRIGVMAFPAGFKPDAFVGTGEAAVQLPSELLTTYSIFVNLNPLYRRWTPR